MVIQQNTICNTMSKIYAIAMDVKNICLYIKIFWDDDMIKVEKNEFPQYISTVSNYHKQFVQRLSSISPKIRPKDKCELPKFEQFYAWIEFLEKKQLYQFYSALNK